MLATRRHATPLGRLLDSTSLKWGSSLCMTPAYVISTSGESNESMTVTEMVYSPRICTNINLS